ncbi:hypothetical protein [Gallaecimonas pentaromativorans]|uniref:hypothetical protein n=1 Tax=Gallaecimonas pentaromativorans TaxID=584787 RepID=UPI003A91E45D
MKKIAFLALAGLMTFEASATTVMTEVGASFSREKVDLGTPTMEPFNRSSEVNPHLMVGVYRPAGDGLLGVGLDWDRSNGRNLLGLRALDYHYPLGDSFEVHGFLGGARLSDTRPAYGYYYGAGVSYKLPYQGWSIGLDFRKADELARDKEPSDPAGRQDVYFDIQSATLSIQKRF